MRSFISTLASLATVLPLAFAQDGTPTKLTDAGTGITFDTWTTGPGMKIGVALPQNALTVDANEFIGYLVRIPFHNTSKISPR